MNIDISLVVRANNIQSFRCKALPLRPRKGQQRSISRAFYANVLWLRRPGPLPAAEAVTSHRFSCPVPRAPMATIACAATRRFRSPALQREDSTTFMVAAAGPLQWEDFYRNKGASFHISAWSRSWAGQHPDRVWSQPLSTSAPATSVQGDVAWPELESLPCLPHTGWGWGGGGVEED